MTTCAYFFQRPRKRAALPHRRYFRHNHFSRRRRTQVKGVSGVVMRHYRAASFAQELDTGRFRGYDSRIRQRRRVTRAMRIVANFAS